MGRFRGHAWRVVRFGAAGVAGLLVDFGTLLALRELAAWPVAVATFAAYVLGGATNYALVRWWVFPGDRSGSEAGRVARYVALVAANAAATSVAVTGLAWVGVDYRAAKVACVVVLFAVNYVVVPRVVLAGSPARG